MTDREMEGRGEGDADTDVQFMRLAECEAEAALRMGEVPVGCVFVCDGRVVARGHNLTNTELDATRHAEMVAVDALAEAAAARAAPNLDGREQPGAHSGQSEKSRILEGCTLYVTCEPCIMCAGALAQLGLQRAVFGCANDKFGGNGSVLCLHESDSPLAAIGWHGYSVTQVGSLVMCACMRHCAFCRPKIILGSLFQGVRAAEAIALFKKFYQRENARAPVPNPSVAKRRKEEETRNIEP